MRKGNKEFALKWWEKELKDYVSKMFLFQYSMSNWLRHLHNRPYVLLLCSVHFSALWWSWRRGILLGLWLSGGSSRKNLRSQDRNLLQEGENGNNPYSHYLQILSSFQSKLSEKPAYTTFRRQQHGSFS